MPKEIILNRVDKVQLVSYTQTLELFSLTRLDTVEFMSGELKERWSINPFILFVLEARARVNHEH